MNISHPVTNESCSVITQCSCSEAPDSFLVLPCPAWRAVRRRASACPPEVSVARAAALNLGVSSHLLCRSLLLHTSALTPCLSAGFFFFALSLTMCALCLFSYPVHLPPPPNVLLFLQLPPPLHLFLSLNVLLLLSCHLYLSEHPPHPHHPPLSAGLLMCCGGYRSAQDRWSRMISELYSFLRGTVWYCCCCCLQNVLSGCLQVPSCFSLSFKRFPV